MTSLERKARPYRSAEILPARGRSLQAGCPSVRARPAASTARTALSSCIPRTASAASAIGEENYPRERLLRHSQSAGCSGRGSRESDPLLSRGASLLRPGRADRRSKELGGDLCAGTFLDRSARHAGPPRRRHFSTTSNTGSSRTSRIASRAAKSKPTFTAQRQGNSPARRCSRHAGGRSNRQERLRVCA